MRNTIVTVRSIHCYLGDRTQRPWLFKITRMPDLPLAGLVLASTIATTNYLRSTRSSSSILEAEYQSHEIASKADPLAFAIQIQKLSLQTSPRTSSSGPAGCSQLQQDQQAGLASCPLSLVPRSRPKSFASRRTPFLHSSDLSCSRVQGAGQKPSPLQSARQTCLLPTRHPPALSRNAPIAS